MINFINVEKMFTAKKGIKNINVSIKNEIIGIIGANGAGKTTFIELLQGFLYPTKGEVLIKGKPTTALDFNLIDVSYTSANTNLPLNMRVFDYVSYIKELNNTTLFEERLKKFAEIMLFDINDKATIKSLSSGMVQKLKIIICIAEEKEIYIFDEPTRGLDPIAIDLFMSLLKRLKEEGKTIVYCTHLLDELENFSDRVLVFKNNQIEKIIDLKNKKEDLKKEFQAFYGLDSVGGI